MTEKRSREEIEKDVQEAMETLQTNMESRAGCISGLLHNVGTLKGESLEKARETARSVFASTPPERRAEFLSYLQGEVREFFQQVIVEEEETAELFKRFKEEIGKPQRMTKGLSVVSPEWKQLRADFAAKASLYEDLTLRVVAWLEEHPPTDCHFRQPNHAVILLRFIEGAEIKLDTAGSSFSSAPEELKGGTPGVLMTLLGVLEGTAVDLFKRMAYRAGSLLPQEQRDEVARVITDSALSFPLFPDGTTFALNRDPLATWVTVILSSVETFAPLFNPGGASLRVDPFTTSLRAIDFLMQTREAHPPTSAASLYGRQFQVALSFPGEVRSFVERVAAILRDSEIHVFYDDWFQSELAVPNLDLVLHRIYASAQLVVVFLCEAYDRKEWCGVEWRVIRDLLKQRQDDRIMYCRFDDAPVSGVLSLDGYVNLQDRTPEEAAELIKMRLGYSIRR